MAAIESRGFLFGAAVAYQLGLGLVPIRKKGKLPYKTVEQTYDLEYGTATLEAHVDALPAGRPRAVIDDLLATGGTAKAAAATGREAGRHRGGNRFPDRAGLPQGTRPAVPLQDPRPDRVLAPAAAKPALCRAFRM
jgi:adenine phosphoribosyltransferase